MLGTEAGLKYLLHSRGLCTRGSSMIGVAVSFLLAESESEPSMVLKVGSRPHG